MKKLFILIFIGIVGCTSDYEKGENLFKQEKYSEAKSHFELVEKGDKNYDIAQLKIEEIDKILEKELFDIVSKASKELFDSAFKAFSYYDFDGAKELFYQIEKTSEFYEKSQYFLSKIDSIEKVMTLHDERINNARKIEEERISKNKVNEDAKALRQVKQQVRVLFNSLIEFKDKSDFHYYGFGVGYKYNKWLMDVQELKNTQEAKLLLGQGFVVGDLEMLGLEYMGSKGKETEYSSWARKNISDGLKK